MDNEGEKKPGVSVHEIENFSKKHRLEIFHCVAFILSALFTFWFFGAAWSIFLAALGGVIGVWLPKKVDGFLRKVKGFVFKQETITQIVLGVVGWILSIFVPPLIFLYLGLMGGKSCYFPSEDVKETAEGPKDISGGPTG
ncbi:MAG: hypothetical protein Tsb0015_05250 [Simkaniaceae bacterium]